MKSDCKHYSKLKVLYIALGFLLLSNTLYASKKVANSTYKAITICTLPQSIFKDQILTGMDVTYSNPQEEQKNAITVIKKELTVLKKKKVTKKLHKEILSLDKSWSATQKKFTKKIEKKSAKKLYLELASFGTSCLGTADKIAKEKKDATKNRVAKINFYVQKLTALYFIKSWGAMDDKLYPQEVQKILTSYQTLYDALIGTKDITTTTKVTLEEINKLFTTFKFMTTSDSGRYMPTLTAKKALDINALTSKILEGK